MIIQSKTNKDDRLETTDSLLKRARELQAKLTVLSLRQNLEEYAYMLQPGYCSF